MALALALGCKDCFPQIGILGNADLETKHLALIISHGSQQWIRVVQMAELVQQSNLYQHHRLKLWGSTKCRAKHTEMGRAETRLAQVKHPQRRSWVLDQFCKCAHGRCWCVGEVVRSQVEVASLCWRQVCVLRANVIQVERGQTLQATMCEPHVSDENCLNAQQFRHEQGLHTLISHWVATQAQLLQYPNFFPKQHYDHSHVFCRETAIFKHKAF
mmetsp:Transcript_10925/g.20782  ORF Transcript_10925/g.20782 Transcript_10925/m.20782 type:complete len:215 (-) Transcript_10925:748-1392(-)